MLGKRIAFRVDVSQEIGTGHYARCMTLAKQLARNGAKISFFCRHINLHTEEEISENGFGLYMLTKKESSSASMNLPHSAWLGVSQSCDAKNVNEFIGNQDIDCFVVDHYALDAEWETMIKDYVGSLFVIDDIADRQHNCDLLLDQNYYVNMHERYVDLVNRDCHLLLGPKYALLRNEFAVERKSIKVRRGVVNRIFVNFGGVDLHDYTTLAIDALANITACAFEVDVVIGNSNPNRISVEELCKEAGYNFHLQTNQMARLMASADLAVGAAGSTSLERCTLGLPTLVFTIAKNQEEITHGLVTLEACISIKQSSKVTSALIQEKVEELLLDPDLVHNMSKRALSVTDGLGVERIIKEMDSIL